MTARDLPPLVLIGIDWASGPDISVEWTHYAAPALLPPEPRQWPARPPKRSPKLDDIINAGLDRLRGMGMKDVTPK